MKIARLRHNIAALASVQVANLLLPLITLPYVTRVLGVEEWGKLAFVQIVLGYFTLMTNWGFAWSATRKVAAARENLTVLSRTFSATWLAQWLIAVVVSLALLLLIALVPFFTKDATMYLLGIGLLFSNVLFPVWFLNGIECMKQVATIQITTRIVALPFIFLLVKSPGDAPLMIAIGAAGGLLSGVLTVLWIRRNLTLIWQVPSFNLIWLELKEGGSIFASTVSISLYTTLTPTILGIVAGHTAVGYYSLADRARLAAMAALSPISQALFPRMSHLFSHDHKAARRLLKKSGVVIVGLSGVVSLVLWFAAEPIVLLLAGVQFAPAAVVLKWLAPLPFIIGLSNLFGVQIMLPNKRMKAFNLILGAAGILSLGMIVPLVKWQGAAGASINTLLTECLVTLAMGIYLFKQGFFSSTERWNKL